MKQGIETFSDFAFSLELHFKCWLEGEKALDDFEQLRKVIKLGQFYKQIPLELHFWLLEISKSKFSERYV